MQVPRSACPVQLAIVSLLLIPRLAFAAEWPHYGGDAGGTKYSPLAQVNRSNVKQLEVAWVLDTEDWSDGTRLPGRSAFEATPLVADGILYVPSPLHRLFAADAESGRILWVFDPKFDPATRVNLYTSRGVALWRDGARKRLFLGDQQGRLFSIDARTGKPDPAFGSGGVLDLRRGMTEEFPQGSYGLTSPVAVCGGVVVTGSWVSDGEPQGPSGDIRGWDARTGKSLWRFHTVPRPGEFGNHTWDGDSWRSRGGTNAWSLMSVDEKRSSVFIPLTSPATDFYGGDRKGANLFGDSVVALDCRTGQRKWHFQTVHHNLWDYDLPAQPVLARVRHDGREVDAVAQITKTGFVFLLDRDTGRPLFPVEERPAPPSQIPGEESWPTQPIPLKPPPFARQSMTEADLTDVTPESRAECREMIRDAVVETSLFRPLGEKLAVMFPGTNGGANWGGGSFDPTAGTLYVNSMDVGAFFRLARRSGDAKIPYRNTGFSRFWDSNQYPCQEPPWGSLTAIDLDRGEIRWRATLGEFPELARRGVPKTGTPNLGGSIVTAGGLVFIAATNDGTFRAFDKDTGEELWSTLLPASGHATPMTYLGRSGRQYVAIAAGGGNKYNKTFAAKLVVFALPKPGAAPVIRRAAARADYRGIEERLPAAVAPQPLAFSHKKHAAITCSQCHTTAAAAERAGLPNVPQCAVCHAGMAGAKPVEWVRVYKLPDYVFFSHARHARASCSECHGAVESRDVQMKERSTSMVACVNCHRARKANTGCDACHQLGQ